MRILNSDIREREIDVAGIHSVYDFNYKLDANK